MMSSADKPSLTIDLCEAMAIELCLCVPKTLSVLIGGGNHLTSAHNDRAAMFCP
jgi:hypothetical protein